MHSDLENLIWLYSIGLEEVLNEEPVNQFGEERQDDFQDKILESSSVTKDFIQQKIIQAGERNDIFKKISEEVSQLIDVSHLEHYFKKFLYKEFRLDMRNGFFSKGTKKKSNLIIITETPSNVDFRNGEVYSGKKKSLLYSIISGMRSSIKEQDFGVITAPVLPFPIGKLGEHEGVEIYHFLYLEKLIKITQPFLIILVGERANNLVERLAIIKRENSNSPYIPHFGIPELDYILSVPKAKKNIWDNWKNLIKREKDESIF